MGWTLLIGTVLGAFMIKKVAGVHQDPFTGRSKLVLVSDFY